MVEVTESHRAQVGEMQVRRALPRRARRTVGAWCFADHMGPTTATAEVGADIGPHPHIGLQTVTWLTAGQILHRDSLGSEQVIRAGQLNLMTAGHGVSHAEQSTGTYAGELEGIQLWVAQPEATRHGEPAFEHHAELPQLDLANATATVIVGELGGTTSPARRDTDHLGAELRLRSGETTMPLESHHEHALVVLDGAVEVDGTTVAPGHLAYLGTARDELGLRASEPATAILLGGTPFPEQLSMWWNFVARTSDEVDEARASWNADDGRFGTVDSPLERIPAPARI
ncbi:MAG: pirin family protein [Actinobacteria bacterium]|nr:pirin family protein [Actinomycetota bacterium]